MSRRVAGWALGSVCAVLVACHAAVGREAVRDPVSVAPASVPPAGIPSAAGVDTAADATVAADGGPIVSKLTISSPESSPDSIVSKLTISPPEGARESPAPSVAAPACPAVDTAKVAPFEADPHGAGVVRASVPPVVDADGVLGPFYEHLAALARGAATDPLRIAVYGDSNMTRDFMTGAMRRALAARFGDAGHGFVALGRPWPWYLHENVRHDVDLRTWQMFATSTNRVADGYYGFANIAAESAVAGATTWVKTADDASPIGRKCSHFDVYYLLRPGGGSFKIQIDGKVERTVDTASKTFGAGFEGIDVPDGPHELACVVSGNGRVRLFGAVLERQPAPGQFGVEVDSLGVGALNFEQMQHVDSATRVAMLAHRKYDLVAFLLGTNMFAPDLHSTWVRNVLFDFRAALPHTPILLMSPPDIVLEDSDAHSDPRIVRLAQQMKAIAADQGTAFWDFREAMGGDVSIEAFMRRGLASIDHVHLTQAGGALMGNRFVQALFADFRRWLGEHPLAGCPAYGEGGSSQQRKPVE